ncbi:hypothetical protein C8J57DRAFT_1218821 [Mycena rebaudengoi]|nr:hypothetical protein C8J57DRAFT_1218821 [Mycena rebaudengoi]
MIRRTSGTADASCVQSILGYPRQFQVLKFGGLVIVGKDLTEIPIHQASHGLEVNFTSYHFPLRLAGVWRSSKPPFGLPSSDLWNFFSGRGGRELSLSQQLFTPGHRGNLAIKAVKHTVKNLTLSVIPSRTRYNLNSDRCLAEFLHAVNTKTKGSKHRRPSLDPVWRFYLSPCKSCLPKVRKAGDNLIHAWPLFKILCHHVAHQPLHKFETKLPVSIIKYFAALSHEIYELLDARTGEKIALIKSVINIYRKWIGGFWTVFIRVEDLKFGDSLIATEDGWFKRRENLGGVFSGDTEVNQALMLGMKTVRVHLQAVQHDITTVAVAESSAKEFYRFAKNIESEAFVSP